MATGYRLTPRMILAILVFVAVAGVAVVPWLAGRKPPKQVPVATASGNPSELNTPPDEPNREEREKELHKVQRKIVTQHVDGAKQDAYKAVERRVAELKSFFDRAKQGADEFAGEALGWRSKWHLMKSYLPYADKTAHERLLRQYFEKHIFAPEDLQGAIKQTVMLIEWDLREIANRMLVELQADLEKLPKVAGIRVPRLDPEVLKEALQSLQESVGQDAAADVGLFVVSEALTTVALRLGVSAGVLSAGAAGAGPSWGVTLVVALIVDMAMSALYDKLFDPQGQIAAKVREDLDELEKLLLEGNKDHPGLRPTALMAVNNWAERHQQALFMLLAQP
jgi:hypothetical protein